MRKVRYVSTRGGAVPCRFEEALFAGLAPDGGLYLPERWPRLERDELAALQGASYQEVTARVLAPFVEDDLSETELRELIARAYGGFDHIAVAPLRQLGPNEWLLELFHGPTLAFKDIALQLLGALFELFLERARARDHHHRRHLRRYRLGGDRGVRRARAHEHRDPAPARAYLGGAAPADDHGRRRERPQRRDRGHLRRLPGAREGACSTMPRFRARLNLAAINSINWGRIMAQAVYYVSAAVALVVPGARSPSPCRPATSATSTPATWRTRWGCRSRS